MYAIRLNNDNTVMKVFTQSIEQGYTNSNWFWVLMNPSYNGTAIRTNTVVNIVYTLPVSGVSVTERLSISNERYDGYLKCILPANSRISSETGTVKAKVMIPSLSRTSNEFEIGISSSEEYHDDTQTDPAEDNGGESSGCGCTDEKIEAIVRKVINDSGISGSGVTEAQVTQIVNNIVNNMEPQTDDDRVKEIVREVLDDSDGALSVNEF